MGVCCLHPLEPTPTNTTEIKVTELESSVTTNNSSITISKATSNLPSNSTLLQISLKQGPILRKMLNKKNKQTNCAFV